MAIVAIVWPVAIALLAATWYMVRSPWGRTLRAMREDEVAVAALGKDVFRYKLQAFSVGAALAGLGGLFLAWQVSTFTPDDFRPTLTFYAFVIVILGGKTNVWAVPVGAIDLRDHLRRHALPRLLAVVAVFFRRAGLPAPDPRRARTHRPRYLAAARHLRQPQGGRTLRPDDAILSAQHMSVRFRGFVAVKDVSLDVARGSITALIGPNGAGKTTLFNCSPASLRASTGKVVFDGESIDGLPAHRRSLRGLVRTFQIPRIFHRLTLVENMLVADPGSPAKRSSAASPIAAP